MTHKEQMLKAAGGELPEVLPYTPRFDLWYNANSYTNTLPKQHRGRTADEIARAETMVNRLQQIEEKRALEAEQTRKEEDKKTTYIS